MPKQLPKVYYGLHMAEGVCEYRDEGKDPYRVLINEATLKVMDGTFEGCPVYVKHVDGVDLENLQNEADGYVVESFYNKFDGKHWVKFMAVSDKAHEAIANGWRLSNTYKPKTLTDGGQWHGVDYLKEITKGEYEHLALVTNPRYDESVIFTPAQFKEYNEKKNLELVRLANSKQGEKKVFNFFEKKKLENSTDLETTNVILPKSKKEVTIQEALLIADRFCNMNGYACEDHMVKVGQNEMSVKELATKYNEMTEAEEKKKNEAEEEEKKKKNSDKPSEEVTKEKQNEEEKPVEAGDDKKKNSKDGGDEDEEEEENFFNSLKNAADTAKNDSPVSLSDDKISRGKSRYGSN